MRRREVSPDAGARCEKTFAPAARPPAGTTDVPNLPGRTNVENAKGLRQIVGIRSGKCLNARGPGTMERLPRNDRATELRQLVRRLEARHPSTHGHSRRVAGHAAALAAELGLAEGMVAKIRTAALLHDVGKSEVPSEILDKPGPLNGEEYTTVQGHPEIGARMVEALGDPAVTAIVRHHHERFDGGGYPAGLQDYEIPLGARIVAVADTYDALISQRPYRPPMSERRALGLLEDAVPPGSMRPSGFLLPTPNCWKRLMVSTNLSVALPSVAMNALGPAGPMQRLSAPCTAITSLRAFLPPLPTEPERLPKTQPLQ